MIKIKSVFRRCLQKLVNGIDIVPYLKKVVKKNNLSFSKEQDLFDYVSAFKGTDYWNEILNSDQKYAEVPIMMKIDFNNPLWSYIPDKYKLNDEVVVRGIIDLVYKRSGGWVIIDYKTDHLQD